MRVRPTGGGGWIWVTWVAAGKVGTRARCWPTGAGGPVAQLTGAGNATGENMVASGFRVEVMLLLMGLPSSGVTIFKFVGFFRLFVNGVVCVGFSAWTAFHEVEGGSAARG